MATVVGGTAISRTKRLASIDALRGFDMLWILGGDTLFRAVAEFCGQPKPAEQMEHVVWNGFRFYDLNFPTFCLSLGWHCLSLCRNTPI